jgi:hypothetical protein
MPDALAERFLVDLGIAAGGGVAVPDVVQVDERQPGALGQALKPARDRVGMRRPTVLLAEEQSVVVVAGTELGALSVKAASLRFAATALPAPRSGLGAPLARARQLDARAR